MSFKLYLPEKYPVTEGNFSSLGLATCWSDPVFLIKQFPTLQDHIGLMGTLYSKEGVSVIVRNLCLNPQIKTLLVWGNSPLSQTYFGIAGREILNTLWEKGVEEDNLVVGTDFRLHKEIDRAAILRVIKEVTLKDISHLPQKALMDEVIEVTKTLKKDSPPYMDSMEFPETVRDTSLPFASEEVGWVVRDRQLHKVWLKLVERILRYGGIKKTEYGNSQKELQLATWIIEKEDIDTMVIPDWPDEVRRAVGLQPEMVKEYAKAFLDPTLPEGASYTYGSRLRAYQGLDQVDEMIDHLKKSIVTRRAVATTMQPTEDAKHSSPPCLSMIQVIVSDAGAVNLFATFRSHDIFKAALPNACALLNLHRYIAEQLAHPVGKLGITSNSAHIYEEDWKNAASLVECGLIGSMKVGFDENNDIDHRGIVRILLDGKQIIARLITAEGVELYETIGTSARDVVMKLAKLDLLSRPDHYADIAIELVKAEIAAKKGKEYIQDRPMDLEGMFLR